ncbi:MAG: hypothetical protein LQ339_006338 [Xanthoria mediterranea]|nr:MAG: hypothetical protein LQ339_006338 [Xanthoria mediterranea]
MLFAAAITCFVIPISLGGDYWAWSSPQVPVLLVLAVLSFTAFVLNELLIDEGKALIPRRMMKNGPLLAAWATLLCYSVCFTSFLYYMPIWFQVVEGLNTIMTGVCLLPFLFGQVGSGIVYALLLQLSAKALSLVHVDNKHKRQPLSIVGGVLFLIGITLVSTLADKLPIGALLAILLFFGAGSGLVFQSGFIEAQIAVSSDDTAMANSLAVVSEYLGAAIGLTISGTINRSSLTRSLTSTTANPIQSPSLIEKVLQDPTLINTLPDPVVREVFHSAFRASLLLTMKTLIGFAAAVLVLSLCVPAANASGDGSVEGDNEQD